MLSRRGSWLAAAMLVCVACTVGKVPAVAPSGTRQSPEATQDGAVLPVVAPGGFGDVLDGMRLAAEELTANGVPLRLERNPTLAAALDRSPRIVIVVGDGETVAQSRQAIESSGTVVVLIGADLYSDRRLFRNVFQVSPPLLWQARILVRYFAADRRHEQVRAVVGGPSAEAQRAALATAFREEGIRLRTAIPLQRVLSDPAALEATDGVIFLGGSGEGGELADAVTGLADPPQLALSSEGLRAVNVPAGTVAAYHYAWGGWAEPIPRVFDFRQRFGSRFERLPSGLEQEGYDAVHALSRGLTEGGVLATLEQRREQTYSSLPIMLGPDDHIFIDESQLGLFAADGPAENEPWVAEAPYWRPLMRTFTYDGEKTNVLDEDKALFFPRWRAPRPSPKYHRSVFGIVTRYGKDPLH